MDQNILWILMICIILQVCFCDDNINKKLEHHIRKRSLREDGFKDFKTASVELIYGEDESSRVSFESSQRFRDHMRLKQHFQLSVLLNLVTKNATFEIMLTQVNSVLNKNAKLTVVSGDKASDILAPRADCFLSGTVEGDETNHAMVSYCNGLTGWFTMGTETYNIETIDDSDGIETVAIAQKPLTTIFDDVPSNNIYFENNQFNEIREKRQVNVLADAQVYTIETVVVLDADYVAGLIDRGYTTNESMIDFITLTWMGVKAEWAKSDQLQKYVRVDVKKIVLYHTNPSWYNPPAVRLTDDAILVQACGNSNDNNEWKDYDHVHWFTTTSTITVGKAYANNMCTDGKKCAVSTGFNPLDYSTAAHELGHCMGMSHDSDMGCTSDTALMGYSVKTGWSECSRLSLEYFIQFFDCLHVENVLNDTADMEVLYPGMVYNDDEMCAILYGDDYKYKDEPGSDPYTCGPFLCVNMNLASTEYGVIKRRNEPVPGRYCGDEMVCTWLKVNSVYQCVGWNNLGFDTSGVVKIAGGWTEWSEQSACTRTCGTGLRYRQRYCTNPKPLNSAWCEGDSLDLTKCNTQPCPDDPEDESDVILQRASETCTLWQDNNLYDAIGKNSSHYLTTGSSFSSVGNGQCEVQCDTIAGQKAGNNERHGLMPDGTSCNHASLSDADVLKLPRWSGMTGHCIQGYCELLDCTNKTGDQRNDGCGVCGGDNSTCQPYDDIYDVTLLNGATETIVVIPANATLIQFYFSYDNMKKYFLELVMPNSVTKVISSATVDTLNQPASFAGTYWYFLRSSQYLYAYGPTNQAVVVQVKNGGTNTNNGIYYGFSLPPQEKRDTCTGQCENGGTWNQSLCSCDCLDGFYGIDCSTTCNKYCQNSQPLATSGCKCECGGRTYALNNCNCRYPFQGPDCSECKIKQCYNGGTFNKTECRCACPDGFGDLDCSSQCEDASGDTVTCETDRDRGWCEIRNEQMERDCYKTCGLCVPGSSTTTSSTTTQKGSTTSTERQETTTTKTTTMQNTPTTTQGSTTSQTGASTSKGATPTSQTTTSTGTTTSSRNDKTPLIKVFNENSGTRIKPTSYLRVIYVFCILMMFT